ncbi:MAG: hypothetical protein JNN16_06700 [Nitrospira sp.]|nr:hypothetical protein [Nitrospira sp.]
MSHVMLIILTLLAVVPCSSVSLLAETAQAVAEDRSRNPHIEVFTPEGSVEGVRQVRARFSEPVVPFGDPRGIVDPFDIDCPEAGTARWADGTNWLFDFKRDLPAGVRCTFSLKAAAQTLSGQKLTGPSTFSFSTGGPVIKWSQPQEGTHDIDEEQVFVLGIDGEVDQPSVLEHVYFRVDGIESRIGVRILSGPERAAVLKHVSVPIKPTSLMVLQARQRFPAEHAVTLVWGHGVRSKSGVATDPAQTLPFRTRGAFRATLSCERAKAGAGCLPFSTMTLNLSAPVTVAQASKIALKDAQGAVLEPVLEAFGGVTFRVKNGVVIGLSSKAGGSGGAVADQKSPDPHEFQNIMIERVQFKGPFVEGQAYEIEVPDGLVDDAGRKLDNADRFPLTVRTGSFPPLAKFPSTFGILESKADPVLPLTVRNLEAKINTSVLPVIQDTQYAQKLSGQVVQVKSAKVREILDWLYRVERKNSMEYEMRTASIFSKSMGKPKRYTIPNLEGTKATEVLGLPLPKSGLYVVEIKSQILGKALLSKPAPMYVATAALVTNLAVHFKKGREASLVWVTALDSGKPVSDATVTIHSCSGNELWKGKTDSQGIARVGPLPEPSSCEWHNDYFVMATTQDDRSFMRSSWQDGIESWRFNLSSGYQAQPGTAAHTVFDRTLLRAGDKVQMKHVIRHPSMHGFAMPKEDEKPKAVVIHHEATSQRYEFPVQWDAQGIAETSWTIPKDAKLGTYGVWLKKEPPQSQDRPVADDQEAFYSPQGLRSGEFRVEEYRVPLMKGVINPPAKPLVAASEATVDLAVSYLAGGSAGDLPVTFRSLVQPKTLQAFEGFEGAAFANGPVRVGLTRERQQDMAEEREETAPTEGESESGQNGGDGQPSKKESKLTQSQSLVLDANGGFRTTVQHLPTVQVPMDLAMELEFRDSNGEVQTVASTVPLWPAHRLVGLKLDSWVATQDRLSFQAIVVDTSGKALTGVPVTVDLFEKKVYSHRKRLLGGFYAYEHVTEVRSVGTVCEGHTDGQGRLACETTSSVSGNVILQAQIADKAQHRSAAHADLWIRGESDWWYGVSDDDRMDVLPERGRYEPGETAKLQVRMPFREATGLITVEREGVIDAYVQPLSGKTPVVELPILDTYAPNVFVSVLAVRGRVEGVKPTALVDLGRPAYKLGLVGINVGWKAHELKVVVASNSQIYRVREKAKIAIKVTRTDEQALPPGSEITLAAVDEGLLQLWPNNSWRLLDAMMKPRNEEVDTSTGQMHVVGKRHFGLKSKPPGGGGGKQPTRELFDTLLLWKGRIPLSEKGEATIDVPLNDSITSFRITAVATAGSQLFGTGSTTIRSTQELMILSGIAPLVREGDRYRSEVTVRNTSTKAMDVTVTGLVRQLPKPLGPQTVALAPGAAKTIGWEVLAPVGVGQLVYEIEATEKGGNSDKLKVVQTVVPAVPVRTFQSTVTQLSRDARFPVERPKDSLLGKGGVSLTVRPSLVGSLGGVEAYMSQYPYSCLEQQASRAIVSQDETIWKKITDDLPAYLDGDGLAKYWPGMNGGSDVLTAYLLAVAHEAGRPIPAVTLEHMLSGLTKFVQGSSAGYSPLNTSDLTIRKLAAIEALSRYDKAEVGMLDAISITPNRWPTSAVIDWVNILRRVPDVKDEAKRKAEGEQVLRTRLNFQGTTMGFSTEQEDKLWWLMTSVDTNVVRLVLTELDSSKWKDDMPRIMRGAIARQKRGHWDVTTANAWGALAVRRFAAAFEREAMTGTTTAVLGSQSDVVNWSKEEKGAARYFSWPDQQAEVAVHHQGTGKPWVTVQSRAAIPLTEPFSSGYRIVKTMTSVSQKQAGQWTQGDVVRVRLDIEAQADMTWVVVNDPIPGGASVMGGVGRERQLLTQDEVRKGWVWPAFEERSFEAFKAYYAYVPKGTFTVEYTVRLNQAGLYQLPSTRVEAMYAPEMLGELPNHEFEVSR